MRKKRVTALVLGWVLVGSVAEAAGAGKPLVCASNGHADVTMTFGTRAFENRTLDCISGEFVVDLTPCAPDGSFALSAPTGSAAIVAIVDRWQDYTDHIGGVTSHFVTDDKIYFAGGFIFSTSGYEERWHMEASRVTGNATLVETEDGVNSKITEYQCRSVKQLL